MRVTREEKLRFARDGKRCCPRFIPIRFSDPEVILAVEERNLKAKEEGREEEDVGLELARSLLRFFPPPLGLHVDVALPPDLVAAARSTLEDIV